MIPEEILSRIRTEAPDRYLTPSPSKEKNKYCCPLCGSGSRSGSGALHRNPDNSLKCFSCGFSGDIISLYQQEHGKCSFLDAVNALAQLCGIDIPKNEKNDLQNRPKQAGTKSPRVNSPLPAEPPKISQNSPLKENADFAAYIEACAERINAPEALEYLSRRGISQATARAYKIGYDEQEKRIIIPAGQTFYTGRTITNARPKYKNAVGTQAAVFNAEALYTSGKPVFVTEGSFDALAIIEAGGHALALNGVSGTQNLIERIREQQPSAPLILCPDQDGPGQKAGEKLREALADMLCPFIVWNIHGHKDANEALTADRAAFSAAVKQTEAEALTAGRPDSAAEYIKHYMQADIAAMQNEIKTGFPALDQESGGLYPGLYAIAAISSLGKTTFVLQMADQIAEQGHEVIFFSLEQSRLELVSKSIARQMAKSAYNSGADLREGYLPGVKTSLNIRKGHSAPVIQKAVEEYQHGAGLRMMIKEGNFDFTVQSVREYVQNFIAKTGKRPIVFIDYLQILQPPEDLRRADTKAATDASITELRRISRDFNIPVIAISSVNRANYLLPIDFESLKESGGIEYTCDAVYGLQLACLNEEVFKTDKKTEQRERVKKAKAETPRRIELVCLKNRYGATGWSCKYNYFPANDLFCEENQEAERPF